MWNATKLKLSEGIAEGSGGHGLGEFCDKLVPKVHDNKVLLRVLIPSFQQRGAGMNDMIHKLKTDIAEEKQS